MEEFRTAERRGSPDGDEGVHSLPTTHDPPPATQPGLRSVSTLAGLLTAVKPAKLSHQTPVLHPSGLLGTSWRTQQRKGESVRRVVGLWVFSAVALLRALRAH